MKKSGGFGSLDFASKESFCRRKNNSRTGLKLIGSSQIFLIVLSVFAVAVMMGEVGKKESSLKE
jgi:hypothetical protein